MNRLENKVAIVTGGGKGIGKGITTALLKEGAKVVITGRTLKTLEETVNEFKDLGHDVYPLVCDGGVREQVKNTIEQTVSKYGSVDIIVNNAQTSKNNLFESLTDDDMALAINSGLMATFYYMQEAFHYIKENGGKIINFASGAGIKGLEKHGAYAAAKEGIRGMSRVAAREWGQYGININVVCPIVETPGMSQWKEQYPDQYEAVTNGIPMKRLGCSENDIGRTVVFLASSDSDYITGQTFNVDGGADARP
ncbi:MAG: SDR family oxidoreductase [Romboutsia sp.]